MNDVTVETRSGAVVYVAHGTAFAFMTTAILFALLVESGDLLGAAEWRERYSI